MKIKNLYNYLVALLFAVMVFAASSEWVDAGIRSTIVQPEVKVYSGIILNLNTATPICSGCPPGWTVPSGVGSFFVTLTHNLNLTLPNDQFSCVVQPFVFSPTYMINNYQNATNAWSGAIFDPATGTPAAGTLTSVSFVCHHKL